MRHVCAYAQNTIARSKLEGLLATKPFVFQSEYVPQSQVEGFEVVLKLGLLGSGLGPRRPCLSFAKRGHGTTLQVRTALSPEGRVDDQAGLTQSRRRQTSAEQAETQCVPSERAHRCSRGSIRVQLPSTARS